MCQCPCTADNVSILTGFILLHVLVLEQLLQNTAGPDWVLLLIRIDFLGRGFIILGIYQPLSIFHLKLELSVQPDGQLSSIERVRNVLKCLFLNSRRCLALGMNLNFGLGESVEELGLIWFVWIHN